jgi:hypothetical protein
MICDACGRETPPEWIREHDGAKLCADCYDEMVWEAKERLAQERLDYQ